MKLKKEFTERNGNLQKKESNLTKNTKEIQTVSNKPTEHSNKKTENKASNLKNIQNQNPNYYQTESSTKLDSQQSQNKLVKTDKNSDMFHKETYSTDRNNFQKFQLQQSESKLLKTDTNYQTNNNSNGNPNFSPGGGSPPSGGGSPPGGGGNPPSGGGNNSSTYYLTEGNNAKKIELQPSQSKQLNMDNRLKEATSTIANKAIKKSVEKYKQALERDDQAVQVVIRTTDTASQTSKKIYKLVKNKKLKKEKLTGKQLQQSKNVLHEQIKQDKLDIKSKKSSIKQDKLKKDTKQIDQAKKQLKIKNEKIKDKKTDLKLVKKEQKNNSFIKKVSKPPLSLSTTAIKNGTSKYKQQLENGNEGTEVVGKGITLVKEGSTALAKANKVRKNTINQNKLKNLSTKLTEGNKNSDLRKGPKNKLQKNSKTQLKKKMVKKKMYANSGKKKTLSAFSGGMKNLFKNIKSKVSFVALKNVFGKKIAIGAGAIFIKLIPILLIFLLLFGVIAFFMSGSGGYEEQQLDANIGSSKNLSPEVEQWRDLVSTEAEALGMSDYINLILAIIQVETGGTGTRDIMQSSESAGYPRNYFQSEEESIRQGVKHLKNIVLILKGYENGYENNAKLIAQSYNFGVAFSNFVGNLGGEYDLEVAEAYSRSVVAPSLGNTTGVTYPYVNEVSTSLGKPYLYRNGGNFMYGELVAQFIGGADITGDFAIVMEELEKYQGWSYVWGGKTPTTGFDCSGLIDWGLQQIGISLPSPASSQYANTVAIDESEAQPGDLIFFKGTYGGSNHISHVGFYIDENTMFDANGSGVGYHDWKTPYWQSHYAGIRRVVK